MRPSPLLLGAIAVAIALGVASTMVFPRDPVQESGFPELEASVLAVATDAWREDAIAPLPSEVRCRAEGDRTYLCDVLSPGGAPVNLRVVLDGRCWTAGVAGFDGIRSLDPAQGPAFTGCL